MAVGQEGVRFDWLYTLPYTFLTQLRFLLES